MAPDKAKSSKGNLLETLTDQGNVDLPDKPSVSGDHTRLRFEVDKE